MRLLLLLLLFMTPLYGQNFENLVDELSGSDVDQLESEMDPNEEKEEDLSSSSTAEEEEIDFETEKEEKKVKNVVTNGVTLQGLDKQTARVYIIDAAIGQPVEFGPLKIVVDRCEQAPYENRQESMAFLRISEGKTNGSSQILFSGWMSAASPGLSALEHPTYDVWVKACTQLNPH